MNELPKAKNDGYSKLWELPDDVPLTLSGFSPNKHYYSEFFRQLNLPDARATLHSMDTDHPCYDCGRHRSEVGNTIFSYVICDYCHRPICDDCRRGRHGAVQHTNGRVYRVCMLDHYTSGRHPPLKLPEADR